MKKPQSETKVPGGAELTNMDRMTAKFAQNRPFLRVYLDTLKALFKVFSLPGVRKSHPWVSEKYTHGVMLPINEELKVDNVLLPYPIISEFIEMSSHRMIMNVCGCRQAYGCKNHSPEIGCINMGESVLDISPGIGRLVSKKEAHEHVRKAIASGLIPYIGKGRIDNTLYMIPDKGKLLGLCFCCHCCCLTDAFNNLPPDHRNRLFPRIEEIRMEVTDECTGCETCVEYCLYEAIHVEKGKAVQNDNCRQCGRCVTYCPSNAIRLSLDDTAFMQDIVRRISSYVDIT